MAAPVFADQGRGHYESNSRDHRVVVVKKTTWYKGDRIQYDNRRFHEVDYRAYHQKAPPRG